MDSRNLGKVPELKRSVSSLTSRINTWNSSKPSSPVRKKARSVKPDVRNLEGALESDLLRGEVLSTPWYQLYRPGTIAEVCVHKKKVTEVREALEKILQGESGTRILLLTGPSGCCKSTVVGQLANELVPKYRTRKTSSLSMAHGGTDNLVEFENDTSTSGTSHMSEFQEFLAQAKYRSGPNLSLILVEDLPNVFHAGTRKSFQDQLLEWLYVSNDALPPLVICLTECEIDNDNDKANAYGVDYSFTAETILGKEVLSHPRLKRIKFNPINTTLMKKALMNLCVKNKPTLVSTNKWSEKERVVNEVARSTGDIRSGVTILQFWATSMVDTPLLARESFVSYFHALGRILHGSKDIEDDNEMINTLVLNSKGHLSHTNFSLGILENYSSFNKGKFSVRDALDVTNSLSESDVLRSVPESLEYCMRKVRYTFGRAHYEEHTHGKPSFPREWKVSLAQNEFGIRCEDYINLSMYKYEEPRLRRDIALQFGFYGPMITKARYYKQRSLSEYIAQTNGVHDQSLQETQVDPRIDVLGRIGGEIGLVSTQDSEFSEDDHRSIARQSIDHLKKSKDAKLQELIEIHKSRFGDDALGEAEEEEIGNDPILDSEDEASASNMLEDDDSIFEILSQKHPRINANLSINESLSDSDLEHL